MIKVLIVEDEELIRKGLIHTFPWVDFDCTVVGEAKNGEEGIELIKELKPDIVITDIKMPKKDGLQMVAEFSEDRVNRGFEVIIITGHADFTYAQKAIEYGVSNFLLKPIDTEELHTVIQGLVAKVEQKRTVAGVMKQVKSIEEFSLLDTPLFVSSTNYRHESTKKALDYIREHCTEKLSLEGVAEEIGVSTTTLKTSIKEDTHHTFNDFLHAQRIQLALYYMCETDMLIYEVATTVGYSEYKYFFKVFKKYIGYSPTEFMKLEVFMPHYRGKPTEEES